MHDSFSGGSTECDYLHNYPISCREQIHTCIAYREQATELGHEQAQEGGWWNKRDQNFVMKSKTTSVCHTAYDTRLLNAHHNIPCLSMHQLSPFHEWNISQGITTQHGRDVLSAPKYETLLSPFLHPTLGHTAPLDQLCHIIHLLSKPINYANPTKQTKVTKRKKPLTL